VRFTDNIHITGKFKGIKARKIGPATTRGTACNTALHHQEQEAATSQCFGAFLQRTVGRYARCELSNTRGERSSVALLRCAAMSTNESLDGTAGGFQTRGRLRLASCEDLVRNLGPKGPLQQKRAPSVANGLDPNLAPRFRPRTGRLRDGCEPRRSMDDREGCLAHLVSILTSTRCARDLSLTGHGLVRSGARSQSPDAAHRPSNGCGL
jgi:hypothetical protein